MPENLEINSFDDLKNALNEALHNGGTSPDAADYLMERFDVLCVDIATKTFGTRADTVTSMTQRGVKSRPR